MPETVVAVAALPEVLTLIVAGKDRVTPPVLALAVIWFAVPVTLVTPALLTVGFAAVPPMVIPALPEVTVLTPVTAPVDPLRLSTPVLFKVMLPPRATLPPPESPVPAVTVKDGLASMALVTPAVAMLIVPVFVIGPPVKPAPVLMRVTEPLVRSDKNAIAWETFD
jgi:hypothetical protein